MKFIKVSYMPYQFAIIPAIGIIKRHSGCYRYHTALALCGDFGVSVLGLVSPCIEEGSKNDRKRPDDSRP